MPQVLDDIALFLQDTAGLGTIGSSTNPPIAISKGFMPTGPDQQIALIETPGEPPLDTLGTVAGRINVERPVLQIVCRGVPDNYAAPRQLAEDIFQSLHGVPATVLNGTRYLAIEALSSPTNLGQDDNARWEVGMNFMFWKEPG